MNKKIVKRNLGIFGSIFFFVVAMIGQLNAQEDVAIGEAVTTGEHFYTDVTQIEAETAVTNIQVITGTDFDHFVYLPIVVTPFLLPQENNVLTLVNAERAKVGCQPLAPQKQLTLAARGHSTDMAVNDYFAHDSLDGRSPWDRMADAGYTSFSAAGENIAAGYSTPASVMAAWMRSSGHRANILNCNFTEIGIGYHYLQNDTGDTNYYHYWTQDFARP